MYTVQYLKKYQKNFKTLFCYNFFSNSVRSVWIRPQKNNSAKKSALETECGMLDNGLAGLDGPGMGSWLMYVWKTCLTLGPGGVDISPEYFHFPALSINILSPKWGINVV